MFSKGNTLFVSVPLGIWIIFGVYFGVGGIVNIQLNKINEDKKILGITDVTVGNDGGTVIYNDIAFKNKAALEAYLNSLAIEELRKIYPFTDSIPEFMGQIITAFAFGLLGATIRQFYKLAYTKESINYVTEPILGMLTGLIVMGLSYTVPNFLSRTDIKLDPISLMFFCLFAGIYNKEFFEKLKNYFINNNKP